MRDNEDEWYRSLVNQHKTFQTPITAIGHYLSPTWYKFHNYGVVLGMYILKNIISYFPDFFYNFI